MFVVFPNILHYIPSFKPQEEKPVHLIEVKSLFSRFLFWPFTRYLFFSFCTIHSCGPQCQSLTTTQHLYRANRCLFMFHPDLWHNIISTSAPLLQESEIEPNKQPDSPSEEEPSTPRVLSINQNPKYQLFLNNEIKTNGVSGKDADGPGGGGTVGENGPRLSRWETNRLGVNQHRGSLESLASRDWDTMSDRVGRCAPWTLSVCNSDQPDCVLMMIRCSCNVHRSGYYTLPSAGRNTA